MITTQGGLARREVVACVVSNGVLSCLVRRSQQVASDRGLWHCVTGYREPGISARTTVLHELDEELGLKADDIGGLHEGPQLTYVADEVNWVVHTFRATTSRVLLMLNWENDAYLWTPHLEGPRDCVWWLGDVYNAVGLRRAANESAGSGAR